MKKNDAELLVAGLATACAAAAIGSLAHLALTEHSPGIMRCMAGALALIMLGRVARRELT